MMPYHCSERRGLRPPLVTGTGVPDPVPAPGEDQVQVDRGIPGARAARILVRVRVAGGGAEDAPGKATGGAVEASGGISGPIPLASGSGQWRNSGKKDISFGNQLKN